MPWPGGPSGPPRPAPAAGRMFRRAAFQPACRTRQMSEGTVEKMSPPAKARVCKPAVTDAAGAPWPTVPPDDSKQARRACRHHLLSSPDHAEKKKGMAGSLDPQVPRRAAPVPGRAKVLSEPAPHPAPPPPGSRHLTADNPKTPADTVQRRPGRALAVPGAIAGRACGITFGQTGQTG